MTSPLNTIVYVIENAKIVAAPIGTFSGFIDETTTPRGVSARLHVRDNELWTWGHQGNFPKLVRTYDTDAEAVRALEESFVYDFWHCDDICAFQTREDAEKFLADNAE